MRIVIDIDWDNGDGFKVDKNYDEYQFYARPDVGRYNETIQNLDKAYMEARAALVGMHQSSLQNSPVQKEIKESNDEDTE